MNDHQMEIVQSRDHDFPYAALEADLRKYAGGKTPWHWHDHFEVTIVCEGAMELRTRQGSFILEAGEGYFLNANVLHQSCALESAPASLIHSQLFTRDLVSSTGLIARRYVSSVENCVALELLRLNPGDARHTEIIRQIKAAFSAAEGDEPGYEIFVAAHLGQMWGGLFRLMQPEIQKNQGKPKEDTLRIKTMLSFIYENCSRNVTVAEIAASAGICERECFRCFADLLNITPMEYLNRHRIALACRALAETTMSIGSIAESCGFSNSGYFGKVFRKMMNCSPGAYRKNHT